MAKLYLFKAKNIDKDFLKNSRECFEKALAIETPRKFIYNVYYIFFKLYLIS